MGLNLNVSQLKLARWTAFKTDFWLLIWLVFRQRLDVTYTSFGNHNSFVNFYADTSVAILVKSRQAPHQWNGAALQSMQPEDFLKEET